MGWNSINDTASRRANLKNLAFGTAKLTQIDFTLTTAVGQLAKTRGILAKLQCSVDPKLLRQFESVDSAFKAMAEGVGLGLEMADEFNTDYRLVRSQRSGEQKRSGSSMASAVNKAATSAYTDLRWAKQMTARDFPYALNRLVQSNDLLSTQDKQDLTALAETLAPPK